MWRMNRVRGGIFAVGDGDDLPAENEPNSGIVRVLAEFDLCGVDLVLLPFQRDLSA